MPKLLQMDFQYTGPFGHEMTATFLSSLIIVGLATPLGR